MKTKNQIIKMVLAVFFIAFLFIGCSQNEPIANDQDLIEDDSEQYYEDMIEYEDVDDTALDEDYLDETTETYESEISDVSETTMSSDNFENYVGFSVEIMCTMFSGEDINIPDDEEVLAIAQRYGFSSLEELGMLEEEYPEAEASELYIEMIQESCPEVFEMLTQMAETGDMGFNFD